MALVDKPCTRRGIGVIMDWVPAHFPKDSFGLIDFDGTCLLRGPDPQARRARSGAPWCSTSASRGAELPAVLRALYWLEQYHIDGLRVDAVASMLYLDYNRQAGRGSPTRTAARRTWRPWLPAQAEQHRPGPPPGSADDRGGVHRVADGHQTRRSTAAWASTSSGTWAG